MINELFKLFGYRKKITWYPRQLKGRCVEVQFHSENELKELYGFDKQDELINSISTEIKEELKK